MLSIRLKQNNLIQGLKVRSLLDCDSNIEFKTLQYADDIILLTKDEESLKFALQDIHNFSKQAGTRLNLEKSEIIGLGRYKLRNQITGINVKENVNCLGISVGHNKSVCIQINWDNKILKLKQTLSNGKKRNLTMIGKISIIKTLGVSKLVFSAQNTSIPEGKVSEINSILYKFLWPNKERLKRKTLILPMEEGGLNMVDIESFFNSLQARWINRIVESNENWAYIGNKLIDNYAPHKLLFFFFFCFLVFFLVSLLYTLRKEKTVVTQTYQIITKHTQHRNKLIIYMITLIHKFILYSHSHTIKKNMTYIYNT